MSQERYLTRALFLAEIRKGFCAPNPSVGAVVVKEGKVIGEGYHVSPGLAHAEVEALKHLSENETAGADLYVTLEPCCHYGKTPPCTELIIKKKIGRVFYGFRDPNPVVSSKGEGQLREAGIDCTYVAHSEIASFYRSYAHWWQTKLPTITAKIALSFDGKISGPNYERVLLTGEKAQAFTHFNRKRADAILTSAATIKADNPKLNARLENEVISKRLYIVDSKLSLPPDSEVFATCGPITVFHGAESSIENAKALQSRGARLVEIETMAGRLSLLQIAKAVGRDGIHDLWVEAGGKLFQSLVVERLLDRAYFYFAPRSLGATSEAAFTKAFSLAELGGQVQWSSLGDDGLCVIDWRGVT